MPCGATHAVWVIGGCGAFALRAADTFTAGRTPTQDHDYYSGQHGRQQRGQVMMHGRLQPARAACNCLYEHAQSGMQSPSMHDGGMWGMIAALVLPHSSAGHAVVASAKRDVPPTQSRVSQTAMALAMAAAAPPAGNT